MYKVDFDSLPWESPIDGVRFKAFEEAGRRIRLVEFEKGFVEPDWCLKGHIGYVLEGQIDVDFDGEIVHYSKGDGVFILKGGEHKHKATVVSEVTRLILVDEDT